MPSWVLVRPRRRAAGMPRSPGSRRREVHPAGGDRRVMPGAALPAHSGRERRTRKRAGEVTKRPRVYELKIRGVASDLVRAEFDDVELWEAAGATWLRTGGADIAALYGLIKRIETLGLVLLKVDEVDPGESDHPAPS